MSSLMSWLFELFAETERTHGLKLAEIFERTLWTVSWPSNIGRLPKDVAALMKGGTALKADEYDHVRLVLPTVLWSTFSLAGEGDAIMKKRPGMSYDPRTVFRGVVEICVALHVLLARHIRPSQARSAVESLALGAKLLRSQGLECSVNWHAAIHMAKFVELYGPVGGFATWAYERNNGLIARFGYFTGDELLVPTTATRQWGKGQLLRSVAQNPAPNMDARELELVNDLCKQLDKTLTGALLKEQYTSENELHIEFHRPLKDRFNLRNILCDCYYPTLELLNILFPDHFVDEYDLHNPAAKLRSAGHVEHPSLVIDGNRYSGINAATKDRDRWISYLTRDRERRAAMVHRIINLQIVNKPEGMTASDTLIFVVRLAEFAEGPVMPWAGRAQQIGYSLYMPPEEGEYRVLALCQVWGPLGIDYVQTDQGLRVVAVEMEKNYTFTLDEGEDDE